MEKKIEPVNKLAELMMSIMNENKTVNTLQEVRDYVKPKGEVKFAWGRYEDLPKDAY